MSESDPSLLTAHLLRGLRIAQIIIVAIILLGLNLVNLLAHLDRYSSALLAVGCFVGLLGIAAADGVLVARRKFWGWLRWPAAVFVLAISWAASASLTAADLVRPAHWSLGVVGWFGVLLFCDTALRHVAAFIGLHMVTTVLLLGSVGRLDLVTVITLSTVLVSSAGFQFAVAAAGSALRAVAEDAAASATARADAVTRETVARRVHDDRAVRYAELRASVLPLLRAIDDGTASPADPVVRRRAAREAGRLRRLFAEDVDTVEPLAADLAALVDIVERRAVMVQFVARPLPSSPPPQVQAALMDQVADILLGAERSARVTIGAAGVDVVVSVVADGAGLPGPSHDGIRTTVTADGGRTWVEARWRSRTASEPVRGS